MSNLDLKIEKFFKKASRRLRANLFLNNMIKGLIMTLALSTILLLLSLFIPIYKGVFTGISILILGSFISLIYSILKLPNNKKQALMIDSIGLEERLSTALEGRGKEEGFYELQKRDTLEVIKSFDIRKKIPINIEKKKIALLLCLTVLFSIGLFVPTEAKTIAKEIENTKKYQKETLDKIEDQKKNIEKMKEFTEEEKKKLIEYLEQAKKEINNAKIEKDIDKALERLDKKLQKESKDPSLSKEKEELLKSIQKDINPKGEEERKERAKKDLEKLTDKLSKNKLTENLAKQLEEGNKDGIDKALKDIKSNMESLGDLEKSQISRELKETSLEIDNEDLKEALKNISKDIKEGNISDDSEKKTSDSLKALVDETEGTVSKDGNKTGNNESQSQGENKGQGEGGDQSQGKGEGQGKGNGSGEGRNQGSKNGINKPGSDTTERKEEVFIPQRNTGNDENLTGNKNNSSSSQIIDSKEGSAERGESINYDEVIGDYRKEAYDSINNSIIPEALKDIIKSYFEGLQ
ncbi:hypothetical protein KQI89_01255 [Clostridium sp. MSJ-4]|uniref:Uncharacterized protein n=1 Tax=Clostridium simiarum TaxID=2841506 RepID=A0ABS6EWD2_9CLOT|nr:hypothetical protein [Clostridium simiarum]MBU5590381.1 hypothetical protein [Clostridium simiarum]